MQISKGIIAFNVAVKKFSCCFQSVHLSARFILVLCLFSYLFNLKMAVQCVSLFHIKYTENPATEGLGGETGRKPEQHDVTLNIQIW